MQSADNAFSQSLWAPADSVRQARREKEQHTQQAAERTNEDKGLDERTSAKLTARLRKLRETAASVEGMKLSAKGAVRRTAAVYFNNLRSLSRTHVAVAILPGQIEVDAS
eukprot:SAG31_NODE_3382_length_4335_cov_2.871813_3_plen_110_part_00